MSLEEVLLWRDRFANAESGAWRNNFDPMALKTVLKQLARFQPMSAIGDLAVAMAADDGIRHDDDPAVTADAVTDEPSPRTSSLRRPSPARANHPQHKLRPPPTARLSRSQGRPELPKQIRPQQPMSRGSTGSVGRHWPRTQWSGRRMATVGDRDTTALHTVQEEVVAAHCHHPFCTVRAPAHAQ